jgi:hypothetical protein
MTNTRIQIAMHDTGETFESTAADILAANPDDAEIGYVVGCLLAHKSVSVRRTLEIGGGAAPRVSLWVVA